MENHKKKLVAGLVEHLNDLEISTSTSEAPTIQYILKEIAKMQCRIDELEQNALTAINTSHSIVIDKISNLKKSKENNKHFETSDGYDVKVVNIEGPLNSIKTDDDLKVIEVNGLTKVSEIPECKDFSADCILEQRDCSTCHSPRNKFDVDGNGVG